VSIDLNSFITKFYKFINGRNSKKGEWDLSSCI